MGVLMGQALVNGILLGGIYAAYSAGFSLIFGLLGASATYASLAVKIAQASGK